MATTNVSSTAPMAAPMHPHVAPLGYIAGNWAGSGEVIFSDRAKRPRIPFQDDMTFAVINGKPALSYRQRSRRIEEDGKIGGPMNSEDGFIRVPEPGKVEMTVAQPTGISTIELGTAQDWTPAGVDQRTCVLLIETECHGSKGHVIRTPTAKAPHVTHFKREWRVYNDDTLEMRFWLTTDSEVDGGENYLHLQASFKKVVT